MLKLYLILIMVLLLPITVTANGDSPDFFTVQTDGNENETEIIDVDIDNYFTGFIVPEHLRGTEYVVSYSGTQTTPLPSKWDWREHGGVTPVKNQGECGSCYAFGSLGMIESYIKIDSGKTYDLSEEQAKNCIFEATGCLGGSIQQTINPFTANGIILEKDMPYNPTNGFCQNIEPTLRITEWNLLSTEKALSRDTLKKYIMNEGPVVTSLVVTDWEKGYNGSYVLNPPLPPDPDTINKDRHAVVLIGWNDSMSDKNVSGHWLFKNSWGTSWGDNGYGKIEYDAANVGTHASIIGGYEKYNPEIYTLNYDDAGWTCSFGAIGFDCIRGMVIHNVNSSDEIEGIEFWTTGATSDIDLYLYDGWDGKKVPRKNYYLGDFGNELYSVKNLKYDEPGYHSIKIDKDIVSSTDTIILIVDITNIDSVHDTDRVSPIAVDHKGPSEVEKTFVSVGDVNNKWYGWWYDAGALKLGSGKTEYADVALRLRVTGTEPTQCEYILIETEGYVRTANTGNKVNFTVNCVDEYGMPTTSTNITWHNSNETVGTMVGSVFNALAVGETTIHAEGTCKFTKSNDIKITVYKSSKDYLTDEEFRVRVFELQDQLDEVNAQNTDELQKIMNLLNNSDSSKTIVRMPNDAVSSETFNDMMDNLQKQIDDMKIESNSLFKKIIDRIIELFD